MSSENHYEDQNRAEKSVKVEDPSHFKELLGSHVARHRVDRKLNLFQESYAEETVNRFNMCLAPEPIRSRDFDLPILRLARKMDRIFCLYNVGMAYMLWLNGGRFF